MKTQGFVFIMTLCFTAVLSMLVLSSMHQVLLYQQAANRQEQVHRRFYQLEYTARALIKAPPKAWSKCRISQNKANKVMQQVRANQGCTLAVGETTYKYLVEDLGPYPCLVTKDAQATRHFRLTLLAHFGEESGDSLLQIRIIEPVDEPIFCDRTPKTIATGISSWRYCFAVNQRA
jgi:hypothetical protein